MSSGVVPEVAEESAARAGLRSALTGAAYGALFMLGLALGVLGGYHHRWHVMGLPAAAVGCVLVLFAVLYGMGRLMGNRMAALVPGIAWTVTSLVLAGPRADLTIAQDAAGNIYLYGGSAALLAAILLLPSSGGSWLLRGA